MRLAAGLMATTSGSLRNGFGSARPMVECGPPHSGMGLPHEQSYEEKNQWAIDNRPRVTESAPVDGRLPVNLWRVHKAQLCQRFADTHAGRVSSLVCALADR